MELSLKQEKECLVNQAEATGLAPWNVTRTDSELYKKIKHTSGYIQTVSNYPKSILKFTSVNKTKHPTQKPVELFEYLIRTFSNQGDTVLDNCSGVGTTAIAALNSERGFICIEKDKNYFEIAKQRIKSYHFKVEKSSQIKNTSKLSLFNIWEEPQKT